MQFGNLGCPTDRPLSVHNRCVIEVFGGVFVTLLYGVFCGCKSFVIGLSQFSSFFLSKMHLILHMKNWNVGGNY